MTISQIAPAKGPNGRRRITLSDGTAFVLLPSVIGDYGIYTGMELDEALLADIRQAGHAADARLRAVHIISATTMTKQGLEQRLREKGASPDDAAGAVDWLTELNLLDDEKTARQIAEQGARRGYGRKRIRQIMYEKKVPQAYWDAALAALPAADEAVDDYLRRHPAAGQAERRRVVNALLRRGFSWDEIKQGLRRNDIALSDAMEDEL